MLTSWLAQLAARAASSLASLVSVAVLSQHLGVSEFGTWTVVVAWVGLAAPLADLGLPSSILRDVSGRADREVELATRVGGALAIQTVLPVLVVPVLAVLGYVVLGQRASVLLLAAASLLPNGLYTVLQIPFAASRRFKATAIVEAAARVATAGVTVLLVSLGLRLPWLLVVLSVPSVLGALLLTVVRPRIRLPKPLFELALIRGLVHQGLPVVASLTLFAFYLRADSLLLALLATRVDVGLYGLAYRVVEAVLAIPSLFMVVAYPVLVTSRAVPAELRRLVGLSVRALAVAASPVLVLALVGSRELMRALGGDAYVRGGGALRLLLLSAVASFGTALLGQLLIVLEQSRFLLLFSLGNVSVNLVANLVLIPLAGIEGAAMSTLITEFLALGIVGRRLVRMQVLCVPWSMLARVGLSSTVGALTWILVLPAGRLAAGLGAGTATALALRISGVVTPDLVREAVHGRA